MSDDGLLQEILLDHFRRPRLSGALADAPIRAGGVNPACGDRVDITARLEDGRLRLLWRGSGCVISQASASLMAALLDGKTREEGRGLAETVRGAVSGRTPDALPEGLEPLAGVRRHPGRVRCALLAWDLFMEGTNNAHH